MVVAIMWYEDPIVFGVIMLLVLVAFIFFKEFYDTMKR